MEAFKAEAYRDSSGFRNGKWVVVNTDSGEYLQDDFGDTIFFDSKEDAEEEAAELCADANGRKSYTILVKNLPYGEIESILEEAGGDVELIEEFDD